MRLLILLLLCIPGLAVAGTTDTDIHARPASPPTFDADHKAVDSTFGSTLLRVTGPSGSNALYESAETQNLAPIQHFHSPWSMSGDHFIVWADRLSEVGGAHIDLYELNRTTYTATRVRTIATPVASMNYNRGVHFSHTFEWIIYAVDTAQTPHAIKKCNVNTTTAYDGLAANTCTNIVTDAEGIEQMTQSDDDDLFSWYTTNKKVKVWRKSTNTVISTLDASTWYSFDESQMSPDGAWVLVKGKVNLGDNWALAYKTTDFNTVQSYSQLSPDYFAGKHSGFGSLWVNECSQFSTYRLAVRNITTDLPNENPWSGGTPRWAFISPDSLTQSMHPSYSISGYIYGGFFRSVGLPSPWTTYMDEIVRIKDDGTEVLRLAHAWSNFYSNSYDEIPSYASPAGDYVLFYSNWNGANSAARHDVFLVNTATSSDVTPPVTTCNKAAGRYQSSQTVSLSANETATIKYCFGAGCTPATTYSGPFKAIRNLRPPAIEVLRFQGTDTTGNVESVKEVVFRKQKRIH